MTNYNFPFPEPPWPEKGVVTVERYGLYGVIAQERETNEREMTLEEQNIGDTGGTLLYETSDTDEARAIYEAGGFERNGVWHVVTRVEDRTKHQAGLHVTPRKTDYDQT